jgi:hypothetical protein
VYPAYWKTHTAIMVFIAFSIGRRIGTRKQVLIRVHPDEPNPLAGATDPMISSAQAPHKGLQRHAEDLPGLVEEGRRG